VLGAELLGAQVLGLAAGYIQVREHGVLWQQVVLVQHAFEHGAVFQIESLALLHAHYALDQEVVEG